MKNGTRVTAVSAGNRLFGTQDRKSLIIQSKFIYVDKIKRS